MSLSDLASLGSFVSGAAVLVSPVCLGLQTRQHLRDTMAMIQQDRSYQTGARHVAPARHTCLNRDRWAS